MSAISRPDYFIPSGSPHTRIHFTAEQIREMLESSQEPQVHITIPIALPPTIEGLILQEERDPPHFNRFTSFNSLLASRDLTLPQINWLLSHGTPSVNFWGTRSIQITGNGFADPLPLSDIAKRIIAFAKQGNELNLRDCTAGMQSITKMRGLYRATDAVMDQSTCITRTLGVFRNFVERIKEIFSAIMALCCCGTRSYSPRTIIELNEDDVDVDFRLFKKPPCPERELLERMRVLIRGV